MVRATSVLSVLLGAAVALAQTPRESARPKVVMEDQFGKRHDLAEYPGDVVVLVFSDREGAEAGRKLGEKLHIHFHPQAKDLPPLEASRAPVRPIAGWPTGLRVPDAKLVAIACIGNVAAVSGTQGALLRALIRTKFREASPAVPVWLDLTDQMRTQFGVQPDVPNVAVIDTQGRLRYTDAGKFDREQLETLIGAIEDLRKEVRLSATTPQAP